MRGYYDRNIEYISKQTIAGSMELKNNGRATSNINRNENNINYLKTILNKKINIFQGIPVYLLSKKWVEKFNSFANAYANGNGEGAVYPGPALNLEILNHIL
jgi:hypothetical protein